MRRAGPFERGIENTSPAGTGGANPSRAKRGSFSSAKPAKAGRATEISATPGRGVRLPSNGSVSSNRPANLVLCTQAFWTNSNWRERFAARQMKCSPRSSSAAAGCNASSGERRSP